jgi:hypothetical protein
MDLKKPLNVSSLLNFKLLLKGSSLEHSKTSLAILLVSSIIGMTFVYLSVDRYKNQDIFLAAKSHYEQSVSEKNLLDSKFKKLAKDNATYFSDLVLSPKSKMELSNALTQLIASSNLKLAKMNLNSADPSKGEMIEIEIDGSYLNIIQFSENCKKIIAASELQSYKLTRAKDGAIIHVAMSIKFNAPPPAENLPLPQNNLAPKPNMDQKVNNYLNDFNAGGFIKTGFVPAKPENVSPESAKTESPASEKKIVKDPFQAPSVTSNPQKGNSNNVSSSGGGYFLSGILYSKEGRFCILTLPSGESKVVPEGEKIGTQFKIVAIGRDHIVVNLSNKKIFVGDEVL